MTKTFIAVRDVNKEKLKEEKIPDIKNLLKIKPIRVGKKVRWSEEIDEILYGREK